MNLTPAVALLSWLDAKPGRSVTALRCRDTTIVHLYRSPRVEPEAAAVGTWNYRAERASASDALAQVLTAALADDDYIARTRPLTIEEP